MHSNITSGYFRIWVMAESTDNSGSPKVKNVCLISYSQCDVLCLPRAEFADIIVNAWHSHSRWRSTQ